MKNRKTETLIYPEFTEDPATWHNVARPPIDEKLVKELENISRTADGRPRYKVEYLADRYQAIEDESEINENGLIVGVERGGAYHENPLAIFQVEIGERYKLTNGQEIFYPTARRHEVPFDAVCIETVYETRSIGVPRYAVFELLDSRTHPFFPKDGVYIQQWVIDERVKTGETETEIKVQSNPRPFLRYDVEAAKRLFTLRNNLKKEEIEKGLEREKAEQARAKAHLQEETKGEWRATTDKFFRDKQYLPKDKTPQIIIHKGQKIL